MARIIISEAEIIEALSSARRELPPDPLGAFTVRELAKKAHKAEATIRDRDRDVEREGLIEEVQLYRSRSNGRPLMVPGFESSPPRRRLGGDVVADGIGNSNADSTKCSRCGCTALVFTSPSIAERDRPRHYPRLLGPARRPSAQG
jgi:hypothetical protein